MANVVNVKDLTVEQLKALHFDCSEKMQILQKEANIIYTEINSRRTEKPELTEETSKED